MAIIEWMMANPKTSIVILAFLISGGMTLVTKYTTDQNRMKELKEIQKACNIKLKEDRLDKDAQDQFMKCQMEMFKHSFKPLAISLLPLLFIFWWIRGVYTEVLASWLWWYIGASVVSSIFIRKALKVV